MTHQERQGQEGESARNRRGNPPKKRSGQRIRAKLITLKSLRLYVHTSIRARNHQAVRVNGNDVLGGIPDIGGDDDVVRRRPADTSSENSERSPMTATSTPRRSAPNDRWAKLTWSSNLRTTH